MSLRIITSEKMEATKYNPGEELLLETQKGEIERVVQLINEKVNINHRDEEGNTALHFAVRYGYLEIVKYLLQNGADINIENALVESPLDIADKTSRLNIEEIEMALYKKVIDNSFNLVEKFVTEENSDVSSNSAKENAERDPKILEGEIWREIKRKESRMKACLNSLKILNDKENKSDSVLTYEQANHLIFFLEAFAFEDFYTAKESDQELKRGVQEYFSSQIPLFKGTKRLIDDIRALICCISKTKISLDDIRKLISPDVKIVNFFRILERYATYICNNMDGSPNSNVFINITAILRVDDTIGSIVSCASICEEWRAFIGAIHEEGQWTYEKSNQMLFNFLVNMSPAIEKEAKSFNKLKYNVFEEFPQIDIKKKLRGVFPIKIESYLHYAEILNKVDVIKDKMQSCLDYLKAINKDINPGCSKFIYKQANAFICFLDAFQIPQIEGLEICFKKLFPTLCDDLELIKTVRHCLYKGSNKFLSVEDVAKLVKSDLDIVDFFKKLEDYVAYTCNEINELRTSADKTTHINSILNIDENLGTNCNDVLKECLLNLLKIAGNMEEWTEERTHEILFNFLLNIPPIGEDEVCGLGSLRKSVINVFHTHKDVDGILKRENLKAVFKLRSILFKYYYAREVIDIFHRIKPGEDHHKFDEDLRQSLNKTEQEFKNTFNVVSTLNKTLQEGDVEFPFFQSSLSQLQEELALSVLTKHYFKYMTIIDDDITERYYENTASCSNFNIRRILINKFINLRHTFSSTSNKYFRQKKDLRNSVVAYNGVKKTFYEDLCQLHLESGNCQEMNVSKLERNCHNQAENTSNQEEITDNQQEKNCFKEENSGSKEVNNRNIEENKGNKDENNRNKEDDYGNKEESISKKDKNIGNIPESNINQAQNDIIEKQITNTLISLLRLQSYYQISNQDIISLFECVIEGNGEFDIVNNSDLLSKWSAPKDENPRFKELKYHIQKWHKSKFIEFYLNDKTITLNVIDFITNILRTFYDAMSTYNIKFVNVEEAFRNQTVLTNLIKLETKFWKAKDLKDYYLFMIFKKLLKLKYAEPFVAKVIIEEGSFNVVEKEDLIKLAEGLLDEGHIYDLSNLLNIGCKEVDLYEVVYKKMFDKNLESMRFIFEDPHHIEIILKHLQKNVMEESNDEVLTLEYNLIKYLNSVVRKLSAAGQYSKALEISEVYIKHPIREKSSAKFELLLGKRREIRTINCLAVSSKQKSEAYEIAFEKQKYVFKKCFDLKTALEEAQVNSLEFNATYLLNLSHLAYTMQFLEDYKGAYDLYENIYQRIKNYVLYNTPVSILEATEDNSSDFVEIRKSKTYTELLDCTSEAAEFLDILKIRVNMVWLIIYNYSKNFEPFMKLEKEIDFYDENVEKFKQIYIMTKLRKSEDRNVADIMQKIAMMNGAVSRVKETHRRSEKEVLRHIIESLQFYNGTYNLQNGYSDMSAAATLRNIFGMLVGLTRNRNSYIGRNEANDIKSRLYKIKQIFNETVSETKKIKKYGNHF